MHGESTSWSETTTFSTRSPRTSFTVLHKFSNFAFSSSVWSSCKPSLVQQTNFFAVVLFQLLDGVLVDRVNHVQDFVPTLLELFDERRSFDRGQVFAGDVVDVVLPFL